MNAIVPSGTREMANSQNALAVEGIPPAGCPSLTKALSEARDRCRTAQKSAHNSFHGYKYADADEVIATGREALAGSGLSLIPIRQRLTAIAAGNQATYALDRTLILSHSSGEFLPIDLEGWPVVPERGRPLDKAFPIALTTSLAYIYRDLLMMKRGKDEDAAAQDDRNTPPPPPPAEVAKPPETISPDQFDALQVLIRQKKPPPDVEHMLATRGLKELKDLPRDLYEWAHAILADGQIDTEQIDRISALVDKRGLRWESVNGRIMHKYGVDRLKLLTKPQADEIEAKLQPKEAPKEPVTT